MTYLITATKVGYFFYFTHNLSNKRKKKKRFHVQNCLNTKTPSVAVQGNITAMWYRNDVIRSVLLLHIHANLDMMLAWDYTSRHAARSTLVMLVANHVQQLRWPAKSLDLNPIDHLLDLLKRKVRAQPLH